MFMTSGQSMNWFSDSSNTVVIVNRGSMKPYLHKMAVDIYHILKEYNVTLTISWLPRADNKESDALSRIVNYDD